MGSKRICCVIPALNESRQITRVVGGVRQRIQDIIVVDDGSSDPTADLAEQAGADVIRHAVTRGKGMALRSGFARAMERGFDAVITLDADGQHLPEETAKFLSAYEADKGDIIIGTRLRDRAAIPGYRYIPNLIGIFCISKAAGCRIEDTQSGFRLYRREVLEGVQLETTGFEIETEVLIKAGRRGFRIHCLPVSAVYQRDYKTHFRPVRDFYRISILVLKLTVFRRFI